MPINVLRDVIAENEILKRVPVYATEFKSDVIETRL